MTAPQYDPEQIARRLKAARALGGYASTNALAAAISERGLGSGTLNAMEQARRKPGVPLRDLRTLAGACGLPSEWFWVPTIEEAIRIGAEALGVSAEMRFDAAMEQFLEPNPGPAQEEPEDDDRPQAAGGEP